MRSPEAFATDVVPWRAERLRRAGLDEESAARVAGDSRYDAHAIFQLVDRGCPAQLAIRIVAPMEDHRR